MIELSEGNVVVTLCPARLSGSFDGGIQWVACHLEIHDRGRTFRNCGDWMTLHEWEVLAHALSVEEAIGLEFIEPNIRFATEGCDLVLRLSHESAPPWATREIAYAFSISKSRKVAYSKSIERQLILIQSRH